MSQLVVVPAPIVSGHIAGIPQHVPVAVTELQSVTGMVSRVLQT